jgi:hypothetical protein
MYVSTPSQVIGEGVGICIDKVRKNVSNFVKIKENSVDKTLLRDIIV